MYVPRSVSTEVMDGESLGFGPRQGSQESLPVLPGLGRKDTPMANGQAPAFPQSPKKQRRSWSTIHQILNTPMTLN